MEFTQLVFMCLNQALCTEYNIPNVSDTNYNVSVVGLITCCGHSKCERHISALNSKLGQQICFAFLFLSLGICKMMKKCRYIFYIIVMYTKAANRNTILASIYATEPL